MTSYFANLRGLFRSFTACINDLSLFPSVKQKPFAAGQKVQNANCSTIDRKGQVCVKNVPNLGDTNVLLRFPLGVHHASVIKPQMYPLYAMQSSKLFSTFSALHKSDKCEGVISELGMQGSKGLIKGEVCEGVARTKYKRVVCPVMPPCLKFIRPPGKVAPISKDRMECGRICMPCCPKARYPPVCFFPTMKKPCCKIPNPRPAFSECDKDCVNKKEICECCHIRPPPCRLLPDIDDSC